MTWAIIAFLYVSGAMITLGLTAEGKASFAITALIVAFWPFIFWIEFLQEAAGLARRRMSERRRGRK